MYGFFIVALVHTAIVGIGIAGTLIGAKYSNWSKVLYLEQSLLILVC